MAITRADVARHAGVSTAVVSYVINDGPRPVAPATRSAVLAAIAELDYRPNRMAQALKGGKTGVIGMVLPSQANPYFAELAGAIERGVSENGQILVSGTLGHTSSSLRHYVRAFADRQIDGLIVASGQYLDQETKKAMSKFPVAFVDRALKVSGTSTIETDNVQGAAYAVEHLQAHGHERICCIAGPPGLQISDNRIAGWAQQQAAAGFPGQTSMIVRAEFTQRGGELAALALLSPDGRRAAAREPVPTAIFVSSDVQAEGVFRACNSLGIRVPNDLAVVSFDGTLDSGYTQPAATTFRQPIAEMAAIALQCVLNSSDPVHAVLKGNLVIRESCGC